MPPGKKTILHVIDALNVGGAQGLLVLLAKKIPRADYETLVCVLQPDGTIRELLEEQGARVFCFNRPRFSILSPAKFFLYFYRNVRDIISLCRRYQVDVVHCHLSDAEFIGIPAGWLAGVRRVISTVHYPALLPERKRGDVRNYLRVLLTRLVYHLADAVVAVSADIADNLKSLFRLDQAKIKIIVNGIDVEAMQGIIPDPQWLDSVGARPGERIITAVGRLMPPKGHCYLLEALARLASKFGNIRLLLVGDGELRGSLERRAHQLGIDRMVSFLGSRSDVHRILSLTEVFVLPSISEGTSLALLEAMAAAKPIVATDIPGNSAILKNGVSGLLVPPGDPEGLACAIAFFLDNREEAAAWGKNAYVDVCRQFHIDKTVTEHLKLWS